MIERTEKAEKNENLLKKYRNLRRILFLGQAGNWDWNI